MMTRLEQETYEVIEHSLPRIADALESIAKSLMTLRCNAAPKDPYKEFLSELKPKDGRYLSETGPGSDDV